MTTYNKYTWVCTGDCDALIEYTFKDGFGWPNGVTELTCPCNSKCTLLSVEDATIQPTTTTKEENMNGMIDEPLSDLEKYNPDLLVTYKVIKGFSDTEYTTDKVRNIEYELHNARTNSKACSSYRNQIDEVRSIIVNSFPDSDDQSTLLEIAKALDIELTKEISWEATIHVSGTMQVSLTEDYDFETMLSEELSVDTSHGDIEIDMYEVANCQESY